MSNQIKGFDHVQLSMPPGGEDSARAFYGGLLDIPEVAKPEALAGRGGCWFRSEYVQIHLGVAADFVPAKKAHPALLVSNLKVLGERLSAAGIVLRTDIPIPGYERLFIEDPFGNRIELMQKILVSL